MTRLGGVMKLMLAVAAVLAVVWGGTASRCLAGGPGEHFEEGGRCLRGEGVTRDPTMAASFFLRAAQGGEPRGQFMIGVLHMEGRGVPVDNLWAYYWINLAVANPALPEAMRQEAAGRLRELSSRLTPGERRSLHLDSGP